MRRAVDPYANGRGVAAVLAITLLSLFLAAASAQQPPAQQQGGARGAQPPAGRGAGQEGRATTSTGLPAPSRFLPVAATTLVDHPETYYGEYVSLTAALEQRFTNLAFSVDQDKTKSTGKEVLVIMPRVNGDLEPNTYVTVVGQVVKFNPDEIKSKTKQYNVDLAPDVVAKFRGRPVVLATNVVNAAGLDVARRIPPAMTAEEAAYQKLMLQVGPANTALRGGIDKMDSKVVQDNAQILKQVFTQTEAFWQKRGKPDAVKYAQEARSRAESIDRAVVAGDWDDVKAEAGTLGQQCAACHGSYRERFDDGSFRIKEGGGL
jgi:hypothetical protein